MSYLLSAILLMWSAGARAEDEPDYGDLTITRHEFAREDGALKPASFICVLPEEVVWAVEAEPKGAILVSRFKKSSPTKPSREKYVVAEEGNCWMGHCVQKWVEPDSKKNLSVIDAHYMDVDNGRWATGYQLNEKDGDPTRPADWTDCETADYLTFMCVTDRRTVFITRDLKGKAVYRTENFDLHAGPGIDLSGPGPRLTDFSESQRFEFKKGAYSYVVDVSTAAGAQITVNKGGRKLQSEECRAFAWNHPAKPN